LFRRFPLRKFFIYAPAQIAGAFTGALLVYANYWRALELFEGGTLTVPGTAALFTTFPLDYMSAGESILHV
jgi:aquaglyceroporin related protein, other eukaryote